jgi:hypothetical protein
MQEVKRRLIIFQTINLVDQREKIESEFSHDFIDWFMKLI